MSNHVIAFPEGGRISQRRKRERLPSEQLLSKQQIAAFVGVSTSTIDNYCRLGMPFHVSRVGGRRRFKASEVEAWLFDGTRRP